MKCEKCGDRFINPVALHQHMTIHRIEDETRTLHAARSFRVRIPGADIGVPREVTVFFFRSEIKVRAEDGKPLSTEDLELVLRQLERSTH